MKNNDVDNLIDKIQKLELEQTAALQVLLQIQREQREELVKQLAEAQSGTARPRPDVKASVKALA